MKIVAVQLDSSWEDKVANFARVEHLLAGAKVEPGSLIVLPEMFATGFSLDVTITAEPADGITADFMRMLAGKYSCAVIGGVIRADSDGKVFNDAVAFGPDGRLLMRYSKCRPFSGAGESEVHVRGDRVAVFEWGGFRIAPMVCYDLRFPELFRDATGRGADLFVVIAAWPSRRIDHWTVLLRARAIENQAAVIGVNRTGKEPDFEYCGGSIAVDVQGRIVTDAGCEEGVMHATVEPDNVKHWRAEFPALRDAGLA